MSGIFETLGNCVVPGWRVEGVWVGRILWYNALVLIVGLKKERMR